MFDEKWDRRFLGLAEYISTWSLDPSTKVGAVIVDEDRRVVSVGYNGFPKGVMDDGRLEDREMKYKIIVHGEMNAILFASRSLKGCTLYTTPFLPCSVCAAKIIQTGMTSVVSYVNNNPRWIESLALTSQLFKEAGIEYRLYNEV